MYLTRYILEYPINSFNVLLINTLSGALDIIDYKKWESIKRNIKKQEFQDEFIKKMMERGYIFSDQGVEKIILSNMYNFYKNYLKQLPIYFMICPTNICNMRCNYCFEENTITKFKGKIISKDELNCIFKTIKIITKLNNDKKKVVIEIFGGEPLLYKTREIIELILSFAKGNNYSCLIITNGTNIDLFVNLFKSYKSILNKIQITLDGPQMIHDNRRKFADGKGSFEKIIKGIELLQQIGIPVVIRTNLDSQNVDYIPDLAKLIMSKKWNLNYGFEWDLVSVTNYHCSLKSNYLLSEFELYNKIIDLQIKNPLMEGMYSFGILKILRYLVQTLEGINIIKNYMPRFHFCEANRLGYYIFYIDGHIYPCPESLGNQDCSIGTFYPEFILNKDQINLWGNRSIFTLKNVVIVKLLHFVEVVVHFKHFYKIKQP